MEWAQLARLAAAVDYISSNIDVDSSSRFPFRARTHEVTDATDHSVPRFGYSQREITTGTSYHCVAVVS